MQTQTTKLFSLSWQRLEAGSKPEKFCLTGDKNSVEYALEAIEFYEGNRDVKIQKVGDTKKS